MCGFICIHIIQFGCLDDCILNQDGVSALVCLSELITRFSHFEQGGRKAVANLLVHLFFGKNLEDKLLVRFEESNFWSTIAICNKHLIHKYDLPFTPSSYQSGWFKNLQTISFDV